MNKYFCLSIYEDCVLINLHIASGHREQPVVMSLPTVTGGLLVFTSTLFGLIISIDRQSASDSLPTMRLFAAQHTRSCALLNVTAVFIRLVARRMYTRQTIVVHSVLSTVLLLPRTIAGLPTDFSLCLCQDEHHATVCKPCMCFECPLTVYTSNTKRRSLSMMRINIHVRQVLFTMACL